MTLLDMVQQILRSMESDEVNSYADTVESQAVAEIVRETYNYLVARMDLPANHQLFQLTASGDNTKPVLMRVPSDVLDIEWIKYVSPDEQNNTEYNEVHFIPLEEFLRHSLTLKEDETDVNVMNVTLDGLSFEIKYYNNRRPMFWTTTDNYNLIFDGIDLDDSVTLEQSKTLCYGKKLPEFQMNDNFIPQLDPTQFQLLLNEARQQAFTELKQMENGNAAYRSRKMFINTQRTKNAFPTKYPEIKRIGGYGRRR